MLKKIKEWKITKLYFVCCEIFAKYEVSQTASSIAYYFTLAVFPFLMFIAALVGVLHFPADALTKAIEPLLSKAVADTILSYYTYLTSVSGVFSLVFGLLFSLFSASRAIHALTYGVNKVYHTHRERSFLASVLHSMLFTVGISAVLLLVLIAISVGSNLPELFDFAHHIRLPITGSAGYIYLIAVFAAFVILTAFYCLAPVERVRIRYALPGSALCILGLHAISFGVSIYVRVSTRFSVLYGSIGAIIIMLLWLYLFGICVLIGALLNRYIEMKKALA
ncbi:MAG: YihY/virulence factor BrkB family protein [Clostridia bacterium]|nr:YihY/virulence factor BrkB family protein [Clostridia bacterium]